MIPWYFGYVILGAALYLESRKTSKKSEAPSDYCQLRKDPAHGVDVWVNHTPQGQMIRLRGSFDEVMAAINPKHHVEEAPPLPASLNVESLPKYFGGCPQCGQMSMVGEGFWRYQVLSRTRGYMDNTTTFLGRCKKCHCLQKMTVDHDD
jgi:hypothetical protein